MNRTLTIALLALTSLLGLCATASAEDLVRVTVSHDFLVQNKIMPAGTYIVSQGEGDPFGALAIHSLDGRLGALLLPNTFGDEVVENPQLIFDSWGDIYVLHRIETQLGVYTFSIPEGKSRMARAQAMKPAAGN
jgi:hypothetical protein